MEAVEDQEHHLAADLSDVSANYGRPFSPTESRTPVNTIYREKSWSRFSLEFPQFSLEFPRLRLAMTD